MTIWQSFRGLCHLQNHVCITKTTTLKNQDTCSLVPTVVVVELSWQFWLIFFSVVENCMNQLNSSIILNISLALKWVKFNDLLFIPEKKKKSNKAHSDFASRRSIYDVQSTVRISLSDCYLACSLIKRSAQLMTSKKRPSVLQYTRKISHQYSQQGI